MEVRGGSQAKTDHTPVRLVSLDLVDHIFRALPIPYENKFTDAMSSSLVFAILLLSLLFSFL